MKRIALYICLIFVFAQMQAQDIKGVWFAGCNLKIDKYAGIDEYQIDSLYGVEGSIVDFISEDKFVIKALGEKERQGAYSKSGDTLFLSVDEFRWKGVVKDETFKLTLIDSVDYGLELYYNKLKPSKVPDSKILNSEKIIGTNWKATFDWGYSTFSFEGKDSLDFINKPKAFISDFSKIRIGTEVGNYQIDSYKNHLFFYLLGKESLAEKIIHISDYSSGHYNGVLFDCYEPMSKPIPVEKIELTENQVFDKTSFNDEVMALSGRYQLQLINSRDSGLSESVKSVISYIDLKEDSACKIEAYVTENIDDTAVLRKLEKSGTWELNPSGHFISMVFDDNHVCYLTIKKEENKLDLYLNRNPWPEENELNTILKFKRQN